MRVALPVCVSALLAGACSSRLPTQSSSSPVESAASIAPALDASAVDIRPNDPSTANIADAAAAVTLGALSEASWLVDLTADKARDAKVGVPLGASEPRPLVVALHGNFDRPEWTCSVWVDVSDRFPFVVCPRGSKRTDSPPGDERWTYGGSTAAAREIDATLAAARERWSDHVIDGPVVYAGFSLGAILGVPIVTANPARFPRVILVEGGQDGWTDARAEAFHRGATEGGITPRVLFVCAQTGCVADSARAKKTLQRHGVEAEVVSAGNVGHRYDGPVAAQAKSRFAWVVEGLPGWQSVSSR